MQITGTSKVQGAGINKIKKQNKNQKKKNKKKWVNNYIKIFTVIDILLCSNMFFLTINLINMKGYFRRIFAFSSFR